MDKAQLPEVCGKRGQAETIHNGIQRWKHIQDAGAARRYKGLVIKDNTVEADKDRWQADKACPVLLYASCGGIYKGTALEKHNGKYKAA